MNRDVEAGLRRSAAQRASSDEEASTSSASRGSSDGEAGGRSSRPKKNVSTSTLSPPPPTTSTFSGTSLFAFLGGPPSTKLSGSLPVRFDDDDDASDGAIEERISLKAFKGRLRSAADIFREKQHQRRRRLLLFSFLAVLFVLVASALATLISAPWWLSATVLKPPRTREVPFVLLPLGGGGGDGETATATTTLTLTSKPSSDEIVPRIIHQSWKTHDTPPQWDEARKSCSELHPASNGWETRLWDDAEARDAVVAAAARIEGKTTSPSSSPTRFSAEELVRAYDSFSNPVQRADLSRYAILYLHGGVYLDLDVRCERALDSAELGLLSKRIVLPRTWPAGISNDVIVAAPGSGLLELALRSAVVAKRTTSILLFVSSYARVMFSTGPMFLTLVALSWESRKEELWVLPARLYGKYREQEKKEKKKSRRGGDGFDVVVEGEGEGEEENAAGCKVDAAAGDDKKKSKRLHGAGAACGALFTHLHGSSWHGKDAEIVASLVRRKRRGGGGGGGDGSGEGGGKATPTSTSTSAAVAASVFFVAGAVAVVARRARRQAQQQLDHQHTLSSQQQLTRKLSSKKPQKHSQRPFGFIGSKAKRTTTTTTTTLTTELGQKQF